jgi:outer membrane protein OmpA-like peptidoglycan-associated protein/uncharacterized protein YidB (DUF937 family)
MFEQLINEAASRFNLSTATVSTLVRGLLSLMTSERGGGIEGFVESFRRAGLGDVLTSWFGGKEGRSLSAANVESALGVNTLDTLASSSGLSRAVTTSAVAYLLPKIIGMLTPKGVLPSNASLMSQLAGFVDRPLERPIERPIERPVAAPAYRTQQRAWPAWLPWAAAAALIALVGWLWMRAPAGTIDPQLTVSNRDGRVTYSGLVRDEGTRDAIVRALNTTFGTGNASGDLRIDPNVKAAGWLPRIGDLLASVKTPGVDLSLDGDAVKLGGWLSAVDRQAIGDKVRGIMGATSTIGTLGDPAVDAMRAANDRAVSALTALGTSGVAADSVVQAMNLAIINFQTGSADIPAESRDVIRRSAAAIKGLPSGSRIEIGGHTDNTGDSSANMSLSQRRADAVKNALVADGVSGDVLLTRGYGDTKPRASNDTEYGRFQNRRIEYAVIQ